MAPSRSPVRASPTSPSLLSPGGYDDDVASLRTFSDQDSDSEDDQILQGSRSTLELSRHDRTVLEEEDELEKLLTKSSPAAGLKRILGVGPESGSSVRIGKREKRKRLRRVQRALRKKNAELAQGLEMDELIYGVEEGLDDSSSSVSTTSLDSGPRTLHMSVYGEPRRALYRRMCLILSAAIVLFVILFLGAYKASSVHRAAQRPRTLFSNGTSLFAPTTILISLDGFRADFLTRGLTPTLNSFIAEGVSPQYMLPSFPSVTFPNHFTLVTGLYPESHGIVGNSFWDPKLQEDFYYTDPKRSMQPKWWNAEPIWVTAETQGVRTAIHMWPGSEAHIGPIEPTFLDKYDGKEQLSRKVNRLLELLDLPGDQDDLPMDARGRRPQFLAAYVPNVDSDGHKYGPNSTEIRDTIAKADKMLADLFQGLRDRNLTDIVNVVVVSDHGMATTSTDRLVQLEDLIDLDLIERIDGWPLRGLRPKREEDVDRIYRRLLESSEPYGDSIEIYTRENMPERFHFSNNDRIAPVWVIPKAGWAVVERPEWDVKEAQKNGVVYRPRGIHGYDHEHPLMRAIFIARGPKFPHPGNSRLDVFQNIEVYNIICDSLEIEPRPNNGTLRLPLKPVGLHSDPDAPSVDTPEDLPASTTANHLTAVTSMPDGPTATTTDFSVTSAGLSPSRPAAQEEASDEDEDKTIFDEIADSLMSFKDWLMGLFGGGSEDKDESPNWL
ncbi:hypothetical protein VTO42DRAFT_7996 [Malbranchea cinnamomea]